MMTTTHKVLLVVLISGGIWLGVNQGREPTVQAKLLNPDNAKGRNGMRVEIDGKDFGSFGKVEGLNNFSMFGLPLAQDKSYVKVTLIRDFVTSPSLYLWAKNSMKKKYGPKDIHLVKVDRSGQELSRQVLYFCQPLSWSIEAKDASLGGFKERIDLAVQKISEND